MSEKNYIDRPRKVTEGSELSKTDEQAMRTSNAILKAATATALAGLGGAAMAGAKLGEAKRRRKGGGGGRAFVTPDAITGRDVTKRFKRN